MAQAVEAIYEQGVLRPLQPLQLVEGQRVAVSLEPDTLTPDEMLRKLPIGSGAVEGACKSAAGSRLKRPRARWTEACFRNPAVLRAGYAGSEALRALPAGGWPPRSLRQASSPRRRNYPRAEPSGFRPVGLTAPGPAGA